MKLMFWLLAIVVALAAAGCKQAPQQVAAAPGPAPAAAPAPPVAPPTHPYGPRPGAAPGSYEELVLTVALPAQAKPDTGETPPATGGHANCPMSESSEILGIQIGQPHGVIVSRVVPGGPAEKAGIKAGDSIVACNGKVVTCPSTLRPLLGAGEKAREVKLTIRRVKRTKDSSPATPAGRAGG